MRFGWGKLLIVVVIAAVALVPVVAFALVDTPDPLTVVAGADPVVAQLSWGASENAVRYAISVSESADGPFAVVEEVEGTTYDYTEGLGGIPYYFRVDAIDATGERSAPTATPAGPVIATWASNPHVAASPSSDKCGVCHVPHSAVAAPIMRAKVGTETAGQTATCLVCHDGDIPSIPDVTAGTRDSFALQSGHALDLPGATGGMTADCASCHDGHAVASESPMVPLTTINGNSVTSTGNVWCLSCHDDGDKNSWYPGTYPSVSAPLRDSSDYPVAGTWPGADAYTGSGNAHRLIPESTQTADASGRALRRGAGDCLYCHAAHRGSNAYDGLVGTFRPTTAATLLSDQLNGDYASACFVCHGGSIPGGFTTAPADIKQYVTSSSSTSTAGHRIKTPGGTLPVGAPLPCYECHNPHGSSRGNGKMISDARGAGLFTAETPASVRSFCFTCHTASDTGRGWDSTSSAFAAVPGEQVVGIPRSGGALRLPMMYQHQEGGTASCDDCHGYSVFSPDNNVHNPRSPLASHTSTPAGTDTTSGTSTDYHSASVAYEYTCTQCHSADLTMEHFKSSTSTATLSAYSTTCLGCHQTKVAGFSGSWDGSCEGNGNACHAVKHQAMASIHDASSQVMSSPGTESEYTSDLVTLINEDWETGNDGWGWTLQATLSNIAPHGGTYSARIQPQNTTSAGSRYAWRTVDTSNLSTATLEFWSKSSSLTAGDSLQVWYTLSGGQTGTKVYLYNVSGAAAETVWTNHSFVVPKSATLTVGFQLGYAVGSTTRYAYYDDIKLDGATEPAWTTAAVPAGSNATRSCGSGYLNGAANCHDVSDLGDIHSRATTTTAGVTYTGCRVCHRDNSAVPKSANCQSAGCHAGVNGATHSSEYHESAFASDATGTFAGTGFQTSWCTGCHFSGIAEEHRRLNAYPANGCAVCHKKAADTGSPLNVSASDTSATIHADVAPDDALCTDCHSSITTSKPHTRLSSFEQFDPTYSGHKAYSTMRGAVTVGTIGTQSITLWSLPADALWLKSVTLNGQPATQLTPTSMVVCSDCHGSISGAAGPHGGTMVANYAVNESTGMPYDDSYTTGGLFITQRSPDWLPAMSNTTALCNKCHVQQIGYNNVHPYGYHQGTDAAPSDGRCINCHTPIPHAWKRPRLIGYTTDPAPYATLKVSALRLRATEDPNGWGIADCTACSVHSAGATVWP